MLGIVTTTVMPAAASRRSLAPREHGAYVELLLPLGTALAMGKPGLAAVLLAAAGVSAFAGHESLLVLLGRRGVRARREDGSRAARVLACWGGAAVVCGVAGLVMAAPDARLTVLLPVVLSALVALFIARDEERTTAGEMVAAASLASVSLPVGLSSGVAPALAWEALGVWSLSFGASTWGVRTVIASHKAPIAWPRRVLPLLVPAFAAAVLWQVQVVSWWGIIAAAPQVLFALIATVSPPHPRSLRRVGYSLMTSCFVTAGLLIVGARW